jgi:hypothetical protein
MLPKARCQGYAIFLQSRTTSSQVIYKFSTKAVGFIIHSEPHWYLIGKSSIPCPGEYLKWVQNRRSKGYNHLQPVLSHSGLWVQFPLLRWREEAIEWRDFCKHFRACVQLNIFALSVEYFDLCMLSKTKWQFSFQLWGLKPAALVHLWWRSTVRTPDFFQGLTYHQSLSKALPDKSSQVSKSSYQRQISRTSLW